MKTLGEKVVKALQPLFEKANKKELWFYNQNMDIWFSPQELKKYQDEGRFLWGPDSWQLRSPNERIAELDGRIKMMESEMFSFKRRISHSWEKHFTKSTKELNK